MRTCRSNNGPRDRRGFQSQSKAEWQKVAAWNPKTWQLEPDIKPKRGDMTIECEYKAEIESLKSLIDGAKVAVELFEATSPAQIEWKKNWLRNARTALEKNDANQ